MNTVRVASGLGPRLLVPHLAETWWWFSLSLTSLLLRALPHTCGTLLPHSHGMRRLFPWCWCTVNIFSNCGIIELAPWCLQTQYCTPQPSNDRKLKEDRCGPQDCLRQWCPCFHGKVLSLDQTNLTQWNWNSQPLGVWGFMFQSVKCFLLSKQMELMHMSLCN